MSTTAGIARQHVAANGAAILALGLIAALLSACSAVGDVADEVGSAVETAVDDASSAIDNAASDQAAPPADDTPADPVATPTATSAGSPADDVALTSVDDGAGVGANGAAILRADRPRLVIEVDVQSGASLSQAALDHLAGITGDVSDKTEIVFEGGNEFASDDASWTSSDLRDAVAANRNTASDNSQVSIHLLVVRGVNERDGQETNAIGLAYGASTIAFFPDRLRGLGGLTGSNDGIARSVLVHELGHLLGLINLTYTSQIDHEDPEHPGHSSSEASVMFHAVETTLVAELFGGGPPDRFDDADLADIEHIKALG